MKLDWELVRETLTEIEDMSATERNDTDFRINHTDDSPEATRIRHVLLLRDAGFVSGLPYESSDYIGLMTPELTWEGHQLLATLRSKDVWERIKSLAKDRGLSLSFELVKIGGKMVLEQILKSGSSGSSIST